MSKEDIHISFILDRSGSMSPIWEATVEGVTGYIAEQTKQPGKGWLTMTIFDDEIKTLVTAWGLSDWPEDWQKKYEIYPRGSTALYDAIAANLRMSDQWLHDNSWFDGQKIAVIMTDGFENASKMSRDDIFKIIRKHEDDGWTFVYLGANQDAWEVAQSMGIRTRGSVGTYDHTSNAVTSSYASVGASTTLLRSAGTWQDIPDQITGDEDQTANISH